MKNIVSFSGGKDSTAMLLMMVEKNMPIDEIIFCDTGKEFESIYSNIDKVEKYIRRPITRLQPEKSFDYLMFNHIKTKGKRKGTQGYGWPVGGARWCTKALKQQTIVRYLKKYKGEGTIEYHGIAADEQNRLNKNNNKIIRYPLADWGITEADALQYCYSKGFDFDGLYTKFKRVSCWCCPMSSLAELKNLYIHFPKRWQKLKEMDSRSYNSFRLDYTLDELELRFKIGNEFLQQYDIPDNPKLRKAIIRDLKEGLL